jgi:hypothetical protein
MVYLISCNAVIYLEGYLKHEMQRTRSSCSKESFEHFDLLVLRDLFQQHATCRLLNHGQVMVREFAGSTRDVEPFGYKFEIVGNQKQGWYN